MSSLHITQAAQAIINGGVIAYPTEGVWGLGCDPWQSKAVFKLLNIKNRSPDKGLILVAANVGQIEQWLNLLTDEEKQRVTSTWPGPYTWIVPCQGLPEWVTGNHQSIALRVSNHPIVQQLCLKVGGPIVSTSANPTGKAPAKTALKVQSYFGNDIDCIVPGALGKQNTPTIIRDAVTGEQLR